MPQPKASNATPDGFVSASSNACKSASERLLENAEELKDVEGYGGVLNGCVLA